MEHKHNHISFVDYLGVMKHISVCSQLVYRHVSGAGFLFFLPSLTLKLPINFSLSNTVTLQAPNVTERTKHQLLVTHWAEQKLTQTQALISTLYLLV